MKKTKYLNQTFGNWTCTHVGVSSVTRAYYKGTKVRTKTPGHRNYYYLFVRTTSDGKFDKMIRLNGSQASKVYKGEKTVEFYANYKENLLTTNFLDKIGYYFINQ